MMSDPVSPTANIVLLKLSTGEELLTELLTGGTNALQIKRPLRIVVIPGKNTSQTNVGLIPWVQFTMDETMSVDRDHIMVIANPLPEFITQYRAAFSTIALPQKSSLIGI